MTKTISSTQSDRLLLAQAFEAMLKPKSRVGLDDTLSGLFERHQLSEQQRGFVTHLAYTLCRYWFALDSIIDQISQFPRAKMAPKTLFVIKMGLIQLSPLVEVPQHAAVYESIELAKQIGLNKKTQGFIHALLQRVVREPKLLDLRSQQHIFPDWLETRLKKGYEATWLKDYIDVFQSIPTNLSIRHNPLKVSAIEFEARLEEKNLIWLKDDSIPEAYIIENTSRFMDIPGYGEGYFVPQDISAMRVGHAAHPIAGQRILEIGAAPGGKTTHLAAMMQNQGEIIALDIKENRLKKLEENAHRMGATIIQTICFDLTQSSEDLPQALKTSFDKIVIDAPCTATGIIRKHPDILLQLSSKEFAKKHAIQSTLLNAAWPLLKEKGQLIYATCSVDPEENEAVITQFLAKQRDATLLSQTAFAMTTQQDGFFIAVLEKN